MNRVLTCVGEYATTPYYFEKTYVNLYSIEELCYCLYENAFMIEADIVSKAMADWINDECKLPELARELYLLVNQRASAKAFVGMILSYVGFYTKDEISRVESILSMNVTMNVFEKLKAKADFLVESRHFALALKEYQKLLDVLPEDEVILRARIFNNMGVANMHLYFIEVASEFFLKSYETDNNEDALKNYLKAQRMLLAEEDYIRLIAENDDAYKLSIGIESELEETKRSFETSQKAEQYRTLFQMRNSEDANIYYSQINKISEELKEDYRDIVLDSGQRDNETQTGA